MPNSSSVKQVSLRLFDAMSVPGDCDAVQWWVSRRGRQGELLCLWALIDGVRLQVYRHVAHREAWTAYVHGVVYDVVLAATDFDAACGEAVALLREARRAAARNQ